jgi:shikimate kinase
MRLRMNFILIGAPDSGKSTLGKKAADALGMCFYDTDKVVTERVSSTHQGLSFFRLMGEFRPTEEAVVRDIAKEAKNAIIATGAETALSANNVQTLRRAGRFIYIKRDMDRMLEEIREKFIPDPARPEVMDAKELSVHLYRELIPEYEKLADFTLENDGDEKSGLEKLINIIRTERSREKGEGRREEGGGRREKGEGNREKGVSKCDYFATCYLLSATCYLLSLAACSVLSV